VLVGGCGTPFKANLSNYRFFLLGIQQIDATTLKFSVYLLLLQKITLSVWKNSLFSVLWSKFVFTQKITGVFILKSLLSIVWTMSIGNLQKISAQLQSISYYKLVTCWSINGSNILDYGCDVIKKLKR